MSRSKPEEQKKEHRKKPPIELVNSFLNPYGMVVNKVRGLKQVASYALFSVLCLVLTREAAENVGRSDKAVSPIYFNT